MNAQQARDKAYEINTAECNSQYAEIQKLIQVSASKGEYSFTFCENIRDDVKLKLKSEGFIIGETELDRDGSYTRIAWK